MLAVDDKCTGVDSRRTAVGIAASQAPIARTSLSDSCLTLMAVSLIIVIDDAIEGLVGVSSTHYPSTIAGRFHIKARESSGGFA